MKQSELAARLGMPDRMVRYLVTEGIIPPADALGRYADGFGEEHLAAGQRYVRLQAMGFPPKAIKILLAGGGRVPLLDAHPVLLSVDPSVDPSTIDVDAVLGVIGDALRRYVADPTPQQPAHEE